MDELKPCSLTDEQIEHMAKRFLCWPLPERFHPDAGISFEPEYNVEWNAKQGLPPSRHAPTGTNLFDYEQAKAMIQYAAQGMPDTRTAPNDVVEAVVGVSQCTEDPHVLRLRFSKPTGAAERAVIQQALNATLQSHPADNTGLVDDGLLWDICRDVAELPDRDSPEDWPEAMLVTADELHCILVNRLTALRSNHDDVVEFAKAVLHGDEEHQAWLTEAAECWVAGKPLPKPRNIKESSNV